MPRLNTSPGVFTSAHSLLLHWATSLIERGPTGSDPVVHRMKPRCRTSSGAGHVSRWLALATCDNFLYQGLQGHALLACQAASPGRAFSMARGSPECERGNEREARHRGSGKGGTRGCWAAVWPAASSAVAHRRGRLPPRRRPRTRPLAVPPSRTPGDRLQERAGRSSRAGHPVAEKAPCQGRSGLRPPRPLLRRRRPLTASFPGKIGTCRKDGEDQTVLRIWPVPASVSLRSSVWAAPEAEVDQEALQLTTIVFDDAFIR
jgi:hypothetical protein